MYEDIQRLNNLARALKDTGLARNPSEALRMAQSMRGQVLRDIQETKQVEEIDLDSKDIARELEQEAEQITTRVPIEYEEEAEEIEHLEEEVEEEKEILASETTNSDDLKKEIEFLRNEQNDFLISSINEKIDDIKKAQKEGDVDRARQEMTALKEQMEALKHLKKR